ncbi:hypothetical protein ACFLWZ_01035 [Chloroflexota bacterium]
MRPHRFKNTKSGPGYYPDSQSEFGVNVSTLASPPDGYRQQF